MKFARYIGLVIILIFSQSLESCQQQVTFNALCPHQPEATLTSERVEEVKLTSTPTTRSGNSSTVQPIGYKFIGKKGQVIKYQIDRQPLCIWLYDPEIKVLKSTTLPKDGIYLLQLAPAHGSGAVTITMTLSPEPIPSPEPIQPPSTDTPGNIDPPKTQPQPSIQRENSPNPPAKLKDKQAVPSSRLTKNDARNLIKKWLEAKKSLFGAKYDKSEVEKITTGEAYRHAGESSNSNNDVKHLSNKGEYFTFDKQQIHNIINIKNQGENRVRVMAIITERRTKHYPKTDKTKTFISNQNFFCYEFQNVDSQWKISRTHQLIKDCKR
jgi:hypothetical protein